MKMMSLLMIILSINFMFMKHPLSMGFILLLQTILSCLMSSLMSNSYLLSYILFLIFVGGMLILFMYMSSIASNEKFNFSMKLFFSNIFILSLYLLKLNFSFAFNYIFNINSFNEYQISMMNKLYMFPHGKLTLMMVIYLLFSLIVVVNIISLKMAPLRSSYV